MNVKDYSPTFRNVLLQEVKIERTEKGIYIPHSAYSEDKNYRVLKTGKDCTEVKPGYIIKVCKGIPLHEMVMIKDGEQIKTLQVMEQQIVGYVIEDDSIRNAHSAESALSGNSQL
jgi:hypothetical protein